jgi:hypothetical protein
MLLNPEYIKTAKVDFGPLICHNINGLESACQRHSFFCNKLFLSSGVPLCGPNGQAQGAAPT